MAEPDPGEEPEADAPLVESPELWDELGRYTWMQDAWRKLPADSRARYYHWVLTSRTRGMAIRRARTVTRRCYTGRPWTDSRYRRRAQAVRDFFREAPPIPPGSDGTTAIG